MLTESIVLALGGAMIRLPIAVWSLNAFTIEIHLLLVVVLGFRQIEGQRQYVARIQTGIDRKQPMEAAQKQSCHHQQHKTTRRFQNH